MTIIIIIIIIIIRVTTVISTMPHYKMTYLSIIQSVHWLAVLLSMQPMQTQTGCIHTNTVCASGIGNNLTTVNGADTEVRTYNTYTSKRFTAHTTYIHVLHTTTHMDIEGHIA